MNRRRPLAVADRLYRALLIMYPRSFREQYGSQVAQVFRACCRETVRERGWPGLILLGISAVRDIAISAVGEWTSEVVRVSRPLVIRTAAWAAILGGAINLVSSLSHLSGPLRAAVPGSIILMALGIVGVYVVLGDRGGHLRRIGLAFLAVGLLLGVIGMAGSALGVLQPNPIAPVINMGEHAGLVFIAAGMMAWGVLAMRSRALGSWSFLPLGIGLLSLPSIVFALPTAFVAVEASVLPLLFAASWMLLGVALLTARRPAPAPRGPSEVGSL